MKNLLTALKDKDTSTVFLDKLIMALKGPLVIAAVLYGLDVTAQGIWYTFISLSALAGIAELGFTTIITQFVSHEYAHLKKNKGFILGNKKDLDKTFSLIRYALKVYCFVIPVAIVILIAVGYFFFAENDKSIFIIWLIYCFLSGGNLLVSLFQAIYKGFDNVHGAHLTICLSNLSSLIIIILSLLSGAGVSALPLSMFVSIVVSTWFIFSLDKKLWMQIYRHKIKFKYNWAKEISQLQLKYALSFLCGYFIFNLYVPIIFRLKGPEIAGQVGLILTIAKAISAFSYVWINAKIPLINMMVAKGNYKKLKPYYIERVKFSLMTFAAGFISLLFIIFLSNHYKIYNERFLDVNTTVLILLLEMSSVVISLYAIYIRAYKIEPFNIPSFVSAIAIACIAYFALTMTTVFNMFVFLLFFQWFMMLPLFLYFGNKGIKNFNLDSSAKGLKGLSE